MNASYRISVTQDDIVAAIRERDEAVNSIEGWSVCQNCPIARAATRTIGFQVQTAGNTIDTYGDGSSFHMYTIPENAEDFIRDFDSRKPVAPIEFVAIKR